MRILAIVAALVIAALAGAATATYLASSPGSAVGAEVVVRIEPRPDSQAPQRRSNAIQPAPASESGTGGVGIPGLAVDSAPRTLPQTVPRGRFGSNSVQ
jgi:hypothetical protein